jgi:hypothetical protein
MAWYTFAMGRKPLPEADRSTTVGIRLPPSDRDALRALCVLPAWRDHDQSGVLRELLRREARAHGLIPPDPSAPQALLRLAPPDASPPVPAPGAPPIPPSPAASLPVIPPGFAVILWPLDRPLPSPPPPATADPHPADQEPLAAAPLLTTHTSAEAPAPSQPAGPVGQAPSQAPLVAPAIERPAKPPAAGPVPSAEELQARLQAHLEHRPELRQSHVASAAGLSKQDVSGLLTRGKLTAEKSALLWAWLGSEGASERR